MSIERVENPAAFYRMLEAYYLNNGLYENIHPELFANSITTTGIKGFRNPARRAVEFHVTHTWPGGLEQAFPILSANPRLPAALKRVWDWSNWSVKKQVAVRWFALFGDWFCKVAAASSADGETRRVYLQNIKPEHVTDFENDERGNLTAIRLDIPRSSPSRAGMLFPASGEMNTEIWDLERGYRAYHHRKAAGAPESSLGNPFERRGLEEFGIDFIPFTHAPFVDFGEARGIGVFSPCLDKIDEVNRMATRLHQLIFRFNKPTLAILANSTDPYGRPLPPPRLSPSLGGFGGSDRGEHPLEDDVIGLPGTSKVEVLVPGLNYAAHLEAIEAQMRELEEDLPELTYYRYRELGANISGRAVRLLLSQAINRTLEARANLESAFIKANKMALSLADNAGLFGKRGSLGSYARGDFEHAFMQREVIPITAEEEANILTAEVSAGVPLELAARRRGWHSEDLRALAGRAQTIEREEE